MKKGKKLWDELQKAEKRLLSASPKEAAKLTAKIVKWKHHVFDEVENRR